MVRITWIFGFLTVATLAPIVVFAQSDVGRFTGLPIPRFVSLGTDEVNLRVGPRRSYDVIATYQRAGLPVKIVDEFDNWRQVEDWDGTKGWIHSPLLAGKRTVMIQGERQPMHRTPNPEDLVVLYAEPSVVGTYIDCQEAWCFIEIEGRRGWVRKGGLWGVLEDDGS
ncbi:MAG: SH3 domain-containing protein [Geminicoccaceae bacterium]